jgi:hypothetical protein
MMTPDAHAARAVKLLERAETANRTDPRRDQDTRLANVHALLGIYGLLEQLVTPRRFITGADDPDPATITFTHTAVQS